MLYKVLQTLIPLSVTCIQVHSYSTLWARLFFLYVTDCSVYFVKHSPNGLSEKKRQFCFAISCFHVLIEDDKLNLISPSCLSRLQLGPWTSKTTTLLPRKCGFRVDFTRFFSVTLQSLSLRIDTISTLLKNEHVSLLAGWGIRFVQNIKTKLKW